MIALLFALTACTYDEEYACSPWEGWWSGTMTGDLEATIVGEFYAYYAGAFVPAGGGSMILSLRDLDLAPLLDESGPTAPGTSVALASFEGGECESAWRGTLGIIADIVILEADGDTGDTGDTGASGSDILALSGPLLGSISDPESEDPASGSGTWSLDGSDGSALAGSWELTWEGDFPSANE